VKLGGTIAIGVLVPALLWIFIDQSGVGGEVVALVLVGGGAVGAQLGWMTRASAPSWLAPVLAGGGIGVIGLAFTQYNDDGPSGNLFGPFLFVGLLAIPAAAAAAGVSVGSRLRRERDSTNRSS
jgi:hypothetical protein